MAATKSNCCRNNCIVTRAYSGLGVIVWKTDLFRRPTAAGIAVLPFENLSNDREDAAFADGVQDDLVTKLAKIAALKVISRTSVMGYRDQHNTRQIAESWAYLTC